MKDSIYMTYRLSISDENDDYDLRRDYSIELPKNPDRTILLMMQDWLDTVVSRLEPPIFAKSESVQNCSIDGGE